ncbi:MAG: hypothetical protein GY820_44615 [Gammaproteobacteria bacterium]|nr:hypothetical protein [Gammaproteobacteria bacterium]
MNDVRFFFAVAPLLPGDLTGRRWLVCLESEMEVIVQCLRYLKHHEKIDYDGA